jgi:hypothetical protein
LDEGIQALGDVLGILPQNIVSKKRDHPPIEQRIPYPDVYEFLKERNRLDIELYEWTKSRSLVDCSALQKKALSDMNTPDSVQTVEQDEEAATDDSENETMNTPNSTQTVETEQEEEAAETIPEYVQTVEQEEEAEETIIGDSEDEAMANDSEDEAMTGDSEDDDTNMAEASPDSVNQADKQMVEVEQQHDVEPAKTVEVASASGENKAKPSSGTKNIDAGGIQAIEGHSFNELTQLQIENYRKGNGIIINTHITHHAGTTICRSIGNAPGTKGSPSFACMGPKPQDNVTVDNFPQDKPWTKQETAGKIEIVRKFFHMIR